MKVLSLAAVLGVGLLFVGCEEEPQSISTVPTLDTRAAPETPKELMERMATAIEASGDILHMEATGIVTETGESDLVIGTYEGWFDFTNSATRINYEKGPDNTTDTPERFSLWFADGDEYVQGADDDRPRLASVTVESCLGLDDVLLELLVCGVPPLSSTHQPTTEPRVEEGKYSGIAAYAIKYEHQNEVSVEQGPPATPNPTPGEGTPTDESDGSTETYVVEYTFWVDSSTHLPMAIETVHFREGQQLGSVVLEYALEFIERDDFDANLLDPREAGYRTEDELEMELLDNPEGGGPVYWLGREFDAGGDIGVLTLEAAESWYHPERPTTITLRYENEDGARLAIDTWEEDDWRAFLSMLQGVDNNSGRWAYGEACRVVTPFEVAGNEGNVIGGYRSEQR